jgi:hypothetical protein
VDITIRTALASSVLQTLADFHPLLLEGRHKPEREEHWSTELGANSSVSMELSWIQELIDVVEVNIANINSNYTFLDPSGISRKFKTGARLPRSGSRYTRRNTGVVPTEWETLSINTNEINFALLEVKIWLSSKRLRLVQIKTIFQKWNDSFDDLTDITSVQELKGYEDLCDKLNSTTSKIADCLFLIECLLSEAIEDTYGVAQSNWPENEEWAQIKHLLNKNDFYFPANGLPARPLFQRLENSIADVSVLYERWVCLKVLEALANLGWIAKVVDKLCISEIILRSGFLEFTKANQLLFFFVAPLVTGDPQSKSLRVSPREHSKLRRPDFVFQITKDGKSRTFILDATISTNKTKLKEKDRYLRELELPMRREVAGQLISRRPLRSWAVAPIGDDKCEITDDLGRTGSIPADPRSFDIRPLTKWLADL